MRFATISLVPLLTLAGIVAGGLWMWSGLAAYVVLYLVLDNVVGPDAAPPPAAADRPWRTWLLVAQVPIVYAAWAAFLAHFAGNSLLIPAARSVPAGELAGAAASLFVSIAIAGTVTAHELVHRTSSPALVAAGRCLLAFILDAAFAIEHVYGHHVRIGTRDDPATARRGETIYAFVWRSSTRSLASAWSIERERLQRRGLGVWSWRNRNLRGFALSGALIAITWLVCGAVVASAFVAACLAGKIVLEMTNYVEHYGLVRVPGTPVAARHSWDTPAPISAIGMFNLGRHAAHHMKATQPYWALPLVTGAPHMPAGLAASALLAAVPPLWFRLMAKRLARWDREQATDGERALAGGQRRAA